MRRIKTVSAEAPIFIVHPGWRDEGSTFSDLRPRVPLGALFRSGNAWQVYSIEEGRARIRSVTLGNRNNEWAEILEGLSVGETVALHPSDRVTDEARVEPFS